MAQKKLDLLGEVCPFPLFKTQAELEQMNSGDVLLIEVDFNQSVRNIIKWCEDQGHNYELDETGQGIWLVTITKK
ncbi:SirA family protein [Thermincola ferriacetica]|uniref:SirA family protein n=2 Tax=Thermincola TaxID=278993 RepID=D5XB68_THEPJ|nr:MULTISPECIES: sulfurtransferase TusA family protein [Thermincola]ADG81388.1 SirA family protein [Thermincola potens JR]KNZ69109.1 SirA family protein [Thermincola ferriacetica]